MNNQNNWHCQTCKKPVNRFSVTNLYECYYPRCPFSTDCNQEIINHEKEH